MKYNVKLLVEDDSDLIDVELHFQNVDYQKIQGTLLIMEEDHYDPLTSGNYAHRTTVCGFKEKRVKYFSASLIEEPKNE